MSNDEKTATAPADQQVEQLNNKEVEEKEAVKVAAETTTEAVAENNGKTQQVEAPADANAKEAAPAAPVKTPKPPKPTVHKVDYEKDTVYLYQFCRTKNTPSPSAFCLKVETWLRMAAVKYENVDHKMKFRSSKGQLPFVEFNGKEIADSAVIIKELGAHFGSDMDAHLTAEQRNVAHTTIAMIENHLHWIDVWWRTRDSDSMLKGYGIDLKHLTGSKLPAPVLKLAYNFSFRRRALKKVRAVGIGVHTPAEIIQMGEDDLKVLTDMLGDKEFFFGAEPTTLDIVAFSNIAQLVVVDKDVAHPLRDWLNENCKNLVAHFERIKEKYFPDWQSMCDTLDMNTHIPKPEKVEPPKEEEKEKKDEEKEKVEDEKEKEVVEEKTPTEAEPEKEKETK